MNLLTGSMTPEQFQQYQQEQQQAFFRWQQSQVLNREFQDLQQNPPSFNSETSQSLTQPQQVDSPKKGGRKKKMSKRGKNVEDEPQEPVAVGRWLPVEEELLATCYVAVSEDNNVGRFHPKWDAPEQVDLTGDVPGATQEDLFGHDARPRPAGKQQPAKKTKSDATASTGGSSASTQFGELIEHELHLKREAAERAFEAQAEKDRTLMRLEELRLFGLWTELGKLVHKESGDSFDYSSSVHVSSTVVGGQQPRSDKVTTTYLHHIQKGKFIQPFGCLLALDEKTFKVLAYSENAPKMLTTVSHTVPNVDQTPVLEIGADVRTIFAGPSATVLFKALGFGEVSLLNLILVHCKTSRKPFYAIVHRVTAKAMGRLQSLPSGSID
ncbi:integrase, catalytic region, zinc finger, CCHC-type containing protein [Tanacetum coccineum]